MLAQNQLQLGTDYEFANLKRNGIYRQNQFSRLTRNQMTCYKPKQL